MRRYAGRYNLLHGGGPYRVREREQVITAGAMPAIVQALTERRRELRAKPRPCSLCGEVPCLTPSACRSQARYEDSPGEDNER